MSWSTGVLLFTTVVLCCVQAEHNLCPDLCICDKWGGLRRVRCMSKRLASIEANIPRRTQALDLSANIISSIPEHGFMDLKLNYIQELNLSSNRIGYISLRAFAGLDQLRQIDLSMNNLQSVIPDLFIANTKLQMLDLSGNNFVTTNPGPFIESHSIEVLNVSRCLISHVYEDTFSGLPMLKTLDISNNLLVEISVHVFDNAESITKLNLINNPLVCDNVNVNSLLLYCLRNAIACKTACANIEKSQKIQIKNKSPILEESSYTPWDDEDFGIETTMYSITNPESDIYFNGCTSLISLIVVFMAGIVIGMLNIFVIISIMRCSKRKDKKIVDRLLQNIMNIGFSTPVPHRRLDLVHLEDTVL